MICNSNTLNGSNCNKFATFQGFCEKHQPKCNFNTLNGLKCKRKVKFGELCHQHLNLNNIEQIQCVFKPTYNIVIFGKGGTGKTTYMKSLLKQKFDKRYISDLYITKYTIEINNAIFNFELLPGQRLHENYDYLGIDAVIVFVTAEVTPLFSKETLSNFNKINKNHNLPVIVVNNVFGSYINKASNNKLKTTLPLFDINVEKNEKITEPLNYLAEILNKN